MRGLSLNPGEPILGQVGERSPMNRLAERAITTLEPQVFNARELLDEDGLQLVAVGIRASVLVPIARGAEVLGLLAIGNSTGEPITPAVITLLQSLPTRPPSRSRTHV